LEFRAGLISRAEHCSEGKTHVASHESALKAHRQSVVRREKNRQFRSKLRSALKTIRTAVGANEIDKAKGQFAETSSLIDKMAAKGIIHDNAAARYKSRIQLSLNKAATPGA
jgi:small subunit ribosomal protein S20